MCRTRNKQYFSSWIKNKKGAFNYEIQGLSFWQCNICLTLGRGFLTSISCIRCYGLDCTTLGCRLAWKSIEFVQDEIPCARTGICTRDNLTDWNRTLGQHNCDHLSFSCRCNWNILIKLYNSLNELLSNSLFVASQMKKRIMVSTGTVCFGILVLLCIGYQNFPAQPGKLTQLLWNRIEVVKLQVGFWW